jgi:hypothetical protein
VYHNQYNSVFFAEYLWKNPAKTGRKNPLFGGILLCILAAGLFFNKSVDEKQTI